MNITTYKDGTIIKAFNNINKKEAENKNPHFEGVSVNELVDVTFYKSSLEIINKVLTKVLHGEVITDEDISGHNISFAMIAIRDGLNLCYDD